MRIEITIEFDLQSVVDWIEKAAADVGREINRVLAGDPADGEDSVETPYNQFGELRAPFDPLQSDN